MVLKGASINYKPSTKLTEEDLSQVVLKGVSSSAGIVIGRAFILMPDSIISPNTAVTPDEIPNELLRLEKAAFNLEQQLKDSLSKVKNESSNIIAIMETNLLILSDPILKDNIRGFIESGYSVESAVVSEFEKQRNFFRLSKDSLLRERAIELDHIKQKLLAALRNEHINFEEAKGAVIVAQSLTTTDVVNFKDAGIIAIITEIGGITSHSSILARSFDIPAVIGVREALDVIIPDMELIVDGFAGIIIGNPRKEILNLYLKKIDEIETHKKRLGSLARLPAETLDHKKIQLMANVNFLEDVRISQINGADGIGLVRSESLIMELSSIPTEEIQYTWYKEIAERAYPKPVVIRAFDIGSDKYSEGMPFQEDNPALGLRGIRFLLSRKDILETQFLALLRASANKNLKIMLPMISSLHEVEFACEILEKCKKSLHAKGIDFDPEIPVGVMIETPAAVMIADGLAEAVDFFSIGTNDLTQYALAADRNNELVSDIFDTFHPAVLRLIHITVQAAHKYGIKVGICGEFAGHTAATDLLLGLDIDELSVAPSIILELKDRIRKLNFSECRFLAQDILNCPRYEQVRIKLDNAINKHNFSSETLKDNNN